MKWVPAVKLLEERMAQQYDESAMEKLIRLTNAQRPLSQSDATLLSKILESFNERYGKRQWAKDDTEIAWRIQSILTNITFPQKHSLLSTIIIGGKNRTGVRILSDSAPHRREKPMMNLRRERQSRMCRPSCQWIKEPRSRSAPEMARTKSSRRFIEARINRQSRLKKSPSENIISQEEITRWITSPFPAMDLLPETMDTWEEDLQMARELVDEETSTSGSVSINMEDSAKGTSPTESTEATAAFEGLDLLDEVPEWLEALREKIYDGEEQQQMIEEPAASKRPKEAEERPNDQPGPSNVQPKSADEKGEKEKSSVDNPVLAAMGAAFRPPQVNVSQPINISLRCRCHDGPCRKRPAVRPPYRIRIVMDFLVDDPRNLGGLRLEDGIVKIYESAANGGEMGCPISPMEFEWIAKFVQLLIFRNRPCWSDPFHYSA